MFFSKYLIVTIFIVFKVKPLITGVKRIENFRKKNSFILKLLKNLNFHNVFFELTFQNFAQRLFDLHWKLGPVL